MRGDGLTSLLVEPSHLLLTKTLYVGLGELVRNDDASLFSGVCILQESLCILGNVQDYFFNNAHRDVPDSEPGWISKCFLI